MSTTKILAGIFVMLLFTNTAFGFSPATHMYLGQETFQIWEDYDAEFVEYLEKPDSDAGGIMTRKLYYLGLTLPDMFDQQEVVQSLVNTLWDNRDNLQEDLEIPDYMHTSISDPLTFSGSPPNSNPEKLRQMVNYAKNQGYHPFYKAIIYGMYMHTGLSKTL